MKKLLFTLLVVAGIANAVTNTVVVEPSAYGSFVGFKPGTYSFTNSTNIVFEAREGYVAKPTLNGSVVNSTNVTVSVASTNGFYTVGAMAYYIRIEDTMWSKQVQKPAATYYNVGTGIWTQVIWTDPNSTFGGATINGVSVSPTASPLKYFIPPPTNTNKTFRAFKASYSVTLTEGSDCCVFSPTNGTYSTGASFTFTVKPNAGYGVNLKTNGVFLSETITGEKTYTFDIKRNLEVKAYPNGVTVTYKGGAFAQSPFNSASSTESIAAPKDITVEAASGYALYKLTDNGKEVGFSGGTYTVGTDVNHTLELTPVTITVAQNPVGACYPPPGVYTNGVASFVYSCTSTNSASEIEGVYFGSEKLTATNNAYTVKATKPNTIWVKSSKYPPSPSIGGVVASVSFAASGDWQYVTFTDPKNFDPTTGQKILPHYGDAVMIQALGGDIDVSQSTNLVSTIYTKTAPYQLELSPITIPDGNTLVINKALPGIWFKGSGNVTISTVQR